MKDLQPGSSTGLQKGAVANADRPLREQDFYAWLLDQADILRAYRPSFLDWAGVAEELEAMGASEKRELKSRLIVLTAHLLKWRYATSHSYAHLADSLARSAIGSASRPENERGWRKTIREQRRALSDLLADNPSLKELPQTLISTTNLYREHIRPDAMDDTGLDIFPVECPWTFDLILASDFWPEP
jgi:hypothetical protein